MVRLTSSSNTIKAQGRHGIIRLDFYVSYNRIDRVLKNNDLLYLYY